MNIITPDQITGVILCGGKGSRMGGADKGLQNWRGLPLAMPALLRLSPQVGQVMINANRNLGAYEALGVPVWPDSIGDYAGPLAGWLAALEQCQTPYLLTVPCDSPQFPADLAERLADALEKADADIAMAATLENGREQLQPVFTLLKSSLLESLLAYLNAGERKIDRWTAQHKCAVCVFDDARAFFNANTLADLQTLDQAPPA